MTMTMATASRSKLTRVYGSASKTASSAWQPAKQSTRCLSSSSSIPAAAAASSSSSAAAEESESQYDGPVSEQQRRRHTRVMFDLVANLGSEQTRESAYRPHKTRLDPITAKELTVSHLLAATAQIGHTLTRFARANQANVYGVRHKLAIIDVEKATLPALRRAAAVVRSICERDGVVLFLGTRPGQQASVLAAAKRLGKNGYHVTTDRWLPGSITNAPKLLAGSVSHALGNDRDLNGLASENSENPSFNSTKLAAQTLQPDLLVVLNPIENLHAIREANQCNIPTMAITDTDVDPRTVTYAIPANDDSLRAVELIVGVLSKAGEQGLRDRQRKLDEQDKLQRRAARGARIVAASSGAAVRAAQGPRNEYAEAREAENLDEQDTSSSASAPKQDSRRTAPRQ